MFTSLRYNGMSFVNPTFGKLNSKVSRNHDPLFESWDYMQLSTIHSWIKGQLTTRMLLLLFSQCTNTRDLGRLDSRLDSSQCGLSITITNWMIICRNKITAPQPDFHLVLLQKRQRSGEFMCPKLSDSHHGQSGLQVAGKKHYFCLCGNFSLGRKVSQ